MRKISTTQNSKDNRIQPWNIGFFPIGIGELLIAKLKLFYICNDGTTYRNQKDPSSQTKLAMPISRN